MLASSGSTGLVEALAGILAHFAYGGVALLLFLTGWLVPIPEEPIIVAAGYLAWDQHLNVWLMIACALFGILCGDLMIFRVGRRHGDWIFRLRLFQLLLPEERLAKARRLFAEHGSKMVFFGRFPAGIRVVVFFTAGNLGVPVGTFIVYDLLAALIAIPISIYGGYYFGPHIDQAIAFAKRSERIGVAAVVAIVLLAVVFQRLRRSRKPTPGAPAPEGSSRERPAPASQGWRKAYDGERPDA